MPLSMSVAECSRLRLRSKVCPVVEVEGDSSSGEEDVEAKSNTRAQCGQFVWPCPRRYPADQRQRKSQRCLKPADLSNQQAGELFRHVAEKVGQATNLSKLHVFDETHKRHNNATGERERHKHLIFKMHGGFGHVKFQREFMKHGVYGHFSFNMVGYVAYLRYCMCESPKKLLADLDTSPWSWPPISFSKLKTLCSKHSPQMEGRNNGARGKKRSLLTFSELTDVFVKDGVKSEKDAWVLAKSRKVAGDDVLYNTLGAARCVKTLVAKTCRAWARENMSNGTLKTHVKFTLDNFLPLSSVHGSLESWRAGGWKTSALILSGD